MSEKIDSLLRRIEELERQNERLQRKAEPVFGPDIPWMNAPAFLQVIRRTVMLCMVPVYVAVPMILLGGTAPQPGCAEYANRAGVMS